MSQLLIIDGASLIHRAYHALPDTLKTAKGEVTNAVYGFVNMFSSCSLTKNPSGLWWPWTCQGQPSATSAMKNIKPTDHPCQKIFPTRFRGCGSFWQLWECLF